MLAIWIAGRLARIVLLWACIDRRLHFAECVVWGGRGGREILVIEASGTWAALRFAFVQRAIFGFRPFKHC